MYLRRHCYDKHRRCPGWAGGGWKYTKDQRCDGGYLDIWDEKSFPRWRFSRCTKCDIRALPLVTRWLDLTWLAWWVPRLPGRARDALERRRWRRERQAERERGGTFP